MKPRKASCAVAAPPNRRATSRWRSPFTGAFHRITAGSVRQEVTPCGTPRAPPRM